MRLFASLALIGLVFSSTAQALTPWTPAWRSAPDATLAHWSVEVTAMGDTADARTQIVRHGAGWAHWQTPAGEMQILDLPNHSLIRKAADASTAERVDLYAEARRRLDIYVALSEAGRRDVINFGAAGAFDRVWLEAAMGLASETSTLALVDTPVGFLAMYDDQVVFSADYGLDDTSQCESPALNGPTAASAKAWLPHAAPIHPDIHARLAQDPTFPCAFSFMVYSPDSPNGRLERWSLTPADPAQPGLPPLADNLTFSLAGAAQLEAILVAVQALHSGQTRAPDAADFFQESQRLRLEGDYAGAFLVGLQETHHLGPCPEAVIGSARLTCANANALAMEASDDPMYQRVAAGVQAMKDGRHAEAVDALSVFIDRDDHAGAAARILTANELVAWGRVGLQARPDLDPAGLLSEALAMDPYAPDAYWHLGQRYLAAGAPAPAWTLFDLGRTLPGREPTPLLAQTEQLEARMRGLAPYWLPFTEESG